MSALSSKLRSASNNALVFFCPGCKMTHHVWVGEGPGPRWTYNGDPVSPTFLPSIKVNTTRLDMTPSEIDDMFNNTKTLEEREAILSTRRHPHVCHSYITNGWIQFLTDCTHHLAGQTVQIPDFPADED